MTNRDVMNKQTMNKNRVILQKLKKKFNKNKINKHTSTVFIFHFKQYFQELNLLMKRFKN